MMDFGENCMAYIPNTNGSNYGVAFQRHEDRGMHPGSSTGRSPLLNSDHSMRNSEYYNEGGSNLNISDPRYAAKYGNPYLRDPRNSDVNGIRRGMISSGADIDGTNFSPVQSPHRAPSGMGGGVRQYATLNTRNGRPYSPNSSVYRNNHGYGTMQQKGTKSGSRERGGGGNPGGSILPGVLTENAKMVGSTTLHSATNAAAVANKYIGTMLGNGSISRPSNENGGYSSISKIPVPLNQKGGKPNHTTNIDGTSNGRMADMKSSNGKGGNFHQEGKVESQYILSPEGNAANQAALATHV